MDDMPTDTPAHARPATSDWTPGQKWYAAGLVALGLGISVIAFRVIYQTVTALATPYMRQWPWSAVVSCEIAFVFLFGLGILLAWRKVPSPVLRGLFMGLLIAGSVILNVWAARGNVPDMVIHLVVVCAFFAVLLTGKAAFTLLRGSKVRADRIGGAEWIAHPLHSLRLQRWMATWGEPSRAIAHARYMRLLYAIAVAQSDVGRAPFRWRRKLPVTLRYQLSTGLLPDAGEDWQATLAAHVRGELHPATPAATVTPPDMPAKTTVTTPPARQAPRRADAAERDRQRAKAKRLLSATPAPTLAEVAAKTGLSERTLSRIKNAPPERPALHLAAK
jgi:hypothetical protein